MDLREMSVLMDLREIWNNLDWDDFQDYITITKILLKQKKRQKTRLNVKSNNTRKKSPQSETKNIEDLWE